MRAPDKSQERDRVIVNQVLPPPAGVKRLSHFDPIGKRRVNARARI
jgi:hypothetical protein